jgi:hypothetical protein
MTQINHVNDLYRLLFDSESDSRSKLHPSGMSFEEWITNQPPIEIEPSQIAFTSWLKITEICKCWKNVASSRWLETVNKDYLKGLSFETWETMSKMAELSIGWALNRYKENREIKS